MSSRFVAVAVPVPLAGALTYSLPDHATGVVAGCRVRVPVGNRKLTGVVMGEVEAAPEGVAIREVIEVLDFEPALPADLLELATFVADYYLAPLGETVKAFLPGDLPPWGDRRISLTDAGAIAPARGAEEAALKALLLERRRLRLADVQAELGLPRLATIVAELARSGRITLDDPGRSGSRYVPAVELRAGDRAAQIAACGRSPQGRAIVEYLDALARPATVRELMAGVGCGKGVIARLVKRDLLRQFSQPVHLDLGRHRLSAEAGSDIVLRGDQAVALDEVVSALEERRFAGFLLHGMTGSGKSEVFLRAAEVALAAGRTAILLVPEIALVPGLARAAGERFGSELAILHSNLSSAERQQEWERLRRGEARVVLGPRSALFAPLADLGLVVVDEEHDYAYKQDKVPRYQGRDLALMRARAHRAAAVLVSATPSLESRHNALTGKLRPLMLTTRAGGASLPEGILVDLRQERLARRPGEVVFTPRLSAEIEIALTEGDQIILLRNRRGYSPRLLCRACGEDFRCAECGLPHTFHLKRRRMICHYCGEESPAPELCPACGEAALEPMGAGTERVEERLRELFPEAVVDVLDADASRRSGGAAAVLERFSRGTTQILVGTQMVAKGHHFPRVALAGVLHADSYLGFPDFRAVERTYALLTQLAGRAGRGARPGRVVIQSFQPDHYAIRAALQHDDELFVSQEMRFRRDFHYPPFTRMVQLVAQHADRDKAERVLGELARALWRHPLGREMRITGPAPAPLERLRGRWRFQLLVRGASGARLRRLVREVVGEAPHHDLVVDVDPQDLM